MKSIIIIHLCVLLRTIIWNGVRGNDVKNISTILENTANGNGIINGIFEPSKDGLLVIDIISVSYKGLLTKKQVTKEVTMKFTLDRQYSDKEFAIYKHLHTIGGVESFEVFGIPAIYYYGMWGDCSMMAMTLFDPEYQRSLRDNTLIETDLLILFREMVRITQYIHGNGVFRGHIHLKQMMFRKQRGFIYDFSVANIFHKDEQRQYAAREDWKQLLYEMFFYIGRTSHRSWLGFSEHDAHRTKSMSLFLSSLKNDSKSNEQFIGLRRVFIELGKYALSDYGTPITESFYDEPSRVIREEIERCAPQPGKSLTPSWLPQDQDNVEPSSSSSDESETPNEGETSSGSFSPRSK